MSLKSLQFLLAAMSPAEKRYVRQFALRNLDGDPHHYLDILDRLLSDKKAKTAEQKPAAAAANYLYRLLLKSLRSYHEEGSVDIRLRELLINAELLLSKRLYEESEDELTRAEKLARRHERYSLLLEILLLRANTVIERQSRQLIPRLVELAEESNRTVDQLSELVFFRNTENRAFALLRSRYYLRSDESQSELLRLVDQDRFAEPAGFSARQLFYNVKAIHAICSGRFADAAQAYEIMMQAWEAVPERMREDTIGYKKLLANYLTVCHSLGEFEKMPEVLRKIQVIPCRNAEEEAEQFQNTGYYELLYRINTDRFDDFGTFVDQLRKGLNRYATKINEARLLLYYYNIAIAWLVLGEWKECDNWLLKIAGHGKSDHRKDIQRASRLLRLVTYYETGKTELLEYELINVERYLRHHKAWFAYEAAVVKFVTKLLAASKTEERDLFARFREQLQKASEGKDSASLPGVTEILLWAEARFSGRTIRELLTAAG